MKKFMCFALISFCIWGLLNLIISQPTKNQLITKRSSKSILARTRVPASVNSAQDAAKTQILAATENILKKDGNGEPVFYYPKLRDAVDSQFDEQGASERCASNELKQCHLLALYNRRLGKVAEFLSLLENACAKQYWPSCFRLGEALTEDHGQLKRAKSLLVMACDKGNVVESCYLYGRLKLEDVDSDGPKAFDEAWQYMLVACEEHSADSCYSLGQVLDDLNFANRSVLYYRKACAIDDSDRNGICSRYLNL